MGLSVSTTIYIEHLLLLLLLELPIPSIYREEAVVLVVFFLFSFSMASTIVNYKARCGGDLIATHPP